RLGPRLAEHAVRHDLEGSFAIEAYKLLRESGFLAAAVPGALGGGDATVGQVAWSQYELARFDGSAALATAMHQHILLSTAWPWRHGVSDTEAVLRGVARGRVLATTGGGDFSVPTGRAQRVDGGWEVSARKSFVSGVPAADIVTTFALTDAGEAIGFSVDL